MPPSMWLWIAVGVWIVGFFAVLGCRSHPVCGPMPDDVGLAAIWPIIALIYVLAGIFLVAFSPFLLLGWLAFCSARAFNGVPGRLPSDDYPL